MYKQRKVVVGIQNQGYTEFNGKLILSIPYYKEQVFSITVPAGKTIEVSSKYDEYLIPKRKYNITAKLTNGGVYDMKTVTVNKKDSLKFIDIYFNKLPEDVLRDWRRNYFHYKSIYRKDGMWHFEIDRWVTTTHYYKIFTENSYFHLKYYLHGTSSYLLVYPFDAYIPLEAGFNYELEVEVIEQASFISDGYISCVSYPNTYKPAFVEMCGAQDDANDYIYHPKSMPEARIYFGDKMLYRTIMTGAYRSEYGWVSDTYAKDTFTLILEQIDEKTYRWRITNFRRTTGKSGRTVLANVDYKKPEGEFTLGSIYGSDVLDRKKNILNIIPFRVVAYSRIGGSSRYPLSKTEIMIRTKRVY